MQEAIIGGLLLGLLGSLHCIGMCGPLVLLFPLNATSKIQGIIQSVEYHFGRILAYVTLGAVFGIVFQLVDIKQFAQWFSLGIGGLFLILWVRELWFSKKVGASKLQVWVLQRFNEAMQWKNGVGMLVAGFFNGLLPCGLVYGALLAAFGTGTTQGSMVFMLFFGLATFPALFIVNLLKSWLVPKLRFSLSKLLPWWLLIFGVFFLLRGANLGIPYLSPKTLGNQSQSQSCCKPIQVK